MDEHLKTVVAAARQSLENVHDEALAHIAERWKSKSTGGIEKLFVDSFAAAFTGDLKREVLLSAVGGRPVSRAGANSSMDVVLDDAFGVECKAMRLPRRMQLGPSGARYDLGQILEDLCRIEGAKSLQGGCAVVFVYGALPSDAETDGQLYRAFHNQLFADYSASLDHEPDEWKARTAHRRMLKALRFDHAYAGASVPKGFAVVRSGSLGAIILPLPRADR